VTGGKSLFPNHFPHPPITDKAYTQTKSTPCLTISFNIIFSNPETFPSNPYNIDTKPVLTHQNK